MTDDVAEPRCLPGDGGDIVTSPAPPRRMNFFKLGLPWPAGCKAASIGPVTTDTLKGLGHLPAIKAREHDINGLVEAILKACGK